MRPCPSGIASASWSSAPAAPARLRSRADLTKGCPERIDLQFLLWIWNYPERSRPRIVKALSHVDPSVEIVTLRSHAEARATLHRI